MREARWPANPLSLAEPPKSSQAAPLLHILGIPALLPHPPGDLNHTDDQPRQLRRARWGRSSSSDEHSAAGGHGEKEEACSCLLLAAGHHRQSWRMQAAEDREGERERRRESRQPRAWQTRWKSRYRRPPILPPAHLHDLVVWRKVQQDVGGHIAREGQVAKHAHTHVCHSCDAHCGRREAGQCWKVSRCWPREAGHALCRCG